MQIIQAASYNIHSAVGMDGVYDPQRIADVLLEMEADVVGLQEVDSRPHPERLIDQFEYLEKATGMRSVAGPNIALHRGQYGNAILTRWPVRAVRLVDLTVPPFEPRGAIDVEILVEGRAVRVMAAHLGLRVRERRRQIERLGELLRDDADMPLVMVGDFNVWGPGRRALARLGAPVDRRSAPPSFPSNLPVLALNRVWARPPQILRQVLAHRTRLSRRASDHLPVKAVVDFHYL